MCRKFIKPFRTGDVVLVKRDSTFNGIHIIQEIHINNINEYEYSTNRGAWISHDKMTLVRECDEKSMTELLRANEEEQESNEEEIED